MWMIITCLILMMLMAAAQCFLITKMNKLVHLVDKVLDEFRRQEIQPLQQQISDIAETISDYPDLCLQVDDLVDFHNEVQAKAQSYGNPLEMVGRKREP